MCILPINIVNQKIFLGCWFLFILLILLSGAKIIFSLFLFLLPSLRYFLLRFSLFYAVFLLRGSGPVLGSVADSDPHVFGPPGSGIH
jgi:hypothetical protein